MSPPWSARQQRQLSYIAEFTADLRYVPGPENRLADALSRPQPAEPSPINSIPSSSVINFSDLENYQETCPDIQALPSSPNQRIERVPIEGASVLCDLSTGNPRPLLPQQCRRKIFTSFHNLAHPGVRTTRRLISARFVWRGLAKDITLWTRSCLDCQRGKVTRHTKTDVLPIPTPGRRFSHIDVDLVGPLPHSSGFTHLFTIIDRTTRWLEAVPLSATASSDCAKALFSSWISCFGVPATITSDRGPQFVSSLWTSLCELLGINRALSTAYHPQAMVWWNASVAN